MSGECQECGGGLLWGGMSWVEHTEGRHQMQRAVLMRAVGWVLRRELALREDARDVAIRYGCVLAVWKIGGETPGNFRTEIPFAIWDSPTLGGVGGEVLAWIGRGLRDDAQERWGVRPHWAQTRVRVFDEREGRAEALSGDLRGERGRG